RVVVEPNALAGRGSRRHRATVLVVFVAARSAGRIDRLDEPALGGAGQSNSRAARVGDRADRAVLPLVAQETAEPVGGFDQAAARVVLPGPDPADAVLRHDDVAARIILIALAATAIVDPFERTAERIDAGAPRSAVGEVLLDLALRRDELDLAA